MRWMMRPWSATIVRGGLNLNLPEIKTPHGLILSFEESKEESTNGLVHIRNLANEDEVWSGHISVSGSQLGEFLSWICVNGLVPLDTWVDLLKTAVKVEVNNANR